MNTDIIKSLSAKLGSVVIAALAACTPQPALADWQYSRWGMSPQEVVAASNGSASPTNSEPSVQGDTTKEVIGTYQAAERTFNVSFYFRHQRLDKVILKLYDSEQCQATTRDLLAVYSLPVLASGARLEWNDPAKGNYVKMVNVGGYCELQYSRAAGASGL